MSIVQNHYCPRLIEVALPIREISAESVRDKNIHHAHISHLHIWWARRPLSASRAVVFATVVPDPDDPGCPENFRSAVDQFLRTNVPSELKYYRRGRRIIRDEDPYAPYEGIPDTPRNRLLMFIAKWSPKALAFEHGKSSNAPKPAELLDDRSLVKWETSDPENHQGREILRIARELIQIAHDGKSPVVLDPFAGGGAIPLEAGRLGCQAIANDYNPVAYLILRATCEFPQKYGKPGKRKIMVEEFGKQVEQAVEVSNVLVHDIEKWAKWILELAREKIGHLYPSGKDGKAVIGYLWARTAPCSNPSCKGEIPLLRNLLLCNKADKIIALTMEVDKQEKTVRFGIAKGKEINEIDGTMVNRGSVLCLYCQQVTPNDAIVRAGQSGYMSERMICVIVEGQNGKEYRRVEDLDLSQFGEIQALHVERPSEPLPHFRNINLDLYGMNTWGSLFNPRQLVAMQTFVSCLHDALDAMKQEVTDEEYRKAIGIYLGLWLDRIAVFNTSVCRWAGGSEIIKTPFSGQAIPMIWDYPEVNPLSDSSGTASTQLRYMLKVIEHESIPNNLQFAECKTYLGSSTSLPFDSKSLDCVVTDPPYYDAIAYADLSDFFYVWLKKSIGNLLPDIFWVFA